jgi:hypothetical protein
MLVNKFSLIESVLLILMLLLIFSCKILLLLAITNFGW